MTPRWQWNYPSGTPSLTSWVCHHHSMTDPLGVPVEVQIVKPRCTLSTSRRSVGPGLDLGTSHRLRNTGIDALPSARPENTAN